MSDSQYVLQYCYIINVRIINHFNTLNWLATSHTAQDNNWLNSNVNSIPPINVWELSLYCIPNYISFYVQDTGYRMRIHTLSKIFVKEKYHKFKILLSNQNELKYRHTHIDKKKQHENTTLKGHHKLWYDIQFLYIMCWNIFSFIYVRHYFIFLTFSQSFSFCWSFFPISEVD